MGRAGTTDDDRGAGHVGRDAGRPLADLYDVALLDLDGVVYQGRHAIPHAVEALEAARGRGMRLAYVTNNASRTPEAVAAHLTDLGVPAEAGDVVTSAQAAARVVAERVPAGSSVLVVGGEGLEAALRERDLKPVRALADGPAAVVQGYAPDVDWRALAEASYAVASGLPWIASNTDRTIPTERGIAPGNGMFVAAVGAATGVAPAAVAGKPLPPMHRESILRTGARHPLVVGDRLDTDIEGAVNAGVDSLLVLSGVTDAAGVLAAPEGRRPTFVAADLRGLLELPVRARRVASDGGGHAWECGGWTVQTAEGRLVLAGGGDPFDGLRAACAAAWEEPGAAGGHDEVLRTLGFAG